ncbi:hypothetical protein ANANG_G00276520 [Anguilla anguilla]|uniref:Uncharacterized protein n=1 Tax=Anguilla anguilla TaxID=7936 RepID=A0A9D3LMQ6_ANGAN|nr:hypothetical protein ANANG_G00276520 [Anguilla anguilla]
MKHGPPNQLDPPVRWATYSPITAPCYRATGHNWHWHSPDLIQDCGALIHALQHGTVVD